MHGPTVRPSPIAGTWYPGTAEAVRAEVDRHLAAVPSRALPGRLVALIAPHAGLRYSGPVAAHAYALLADRPAPTVVLVGPSHRMAFQGAAVFVAGAFETPLGRAAIDADLAAALRRRRPRGPPRGRASAPRRALARDAAPVRAAAAAVTRASCRS